MIKVSLILKEIIEKDEIVLEALRLGVLNISAYAKLIQVELEEKCKKEVKLGTIIVAISRLAEKIKKTPSLKLKIFINDIIVKTPLSVISYEKTSVNLTKLSIFQKLIINKNDFFTVTLGVDEITIVCSKNLVKSVKQKFEAEPKSSLDNLMGVTIKFPEKYLEIPNILYTFIAKLAAKRINLVEVISTHSEITFIINGKDLKLINMVLEEFLEK